MKKIISILMVLCCMIFPLRTMAAEPTGNTSVENDYSKIVDEQSNSIQPRYQYKVVTAGGNLNVRDYPSTTTGKVIGTLPNRTIIEIPFMQPGWIPAGWSYTSYPIEGYVSDQYIGNID